MNTNIYIKAIKTDDAGYITDIELSENTIDFAKLTINGTKVGTDYYPELDITENGTYDEGPYGKVTVTVE
jgi:hypothetical protein